MKYTWQQNLRFIAEYVFFDDAPELLGVTKKKLTDWVTEKRKPSQMEQLLIEAVADKLDAQQLLETVQASLEFAGHGNVPPPSQFPPFLREHVSGKYGSPVYIYDFRGITEMEVREFFRFIKTVAPDSNFFYTYVVTVAGIEKDGMFFSDEMVEQLKKIHNVRSPIKAIKLELGTASAWADIDKVKGGWKVKGVRYINTKYINICALAGSNTCEIMTDDELVGLWRHYNDASARREVVEIGVSYRRPIDRTPEEIAEDIERGADPRTGLVYVWSD